MKDKTTDKIAHIKSYELIKADKYNEIVQMNHNDITEYLKKNLYNSNIIADFIDFAQEANKKNNLHLNSNKYDTNWRICVVLY